MPSLRSYTLAESDGIYHSIPVFHLSTGVEIEFDPTSYPVAEGSMAEIMVVLRGEISQSVSVQFATQDMSAIGRYEYQLHILRDICFEYQHNYYLEVEYHF